MARDEKRGRGLGEASKALLDASIAVVNRCKPTTVRGIAYQLFEIYRLIPSMEKKNVDRVGRMVLYGREHGFISWDDVVDESREIEVPATWDNLEQFAETVADSYRKDSWQSQPYHISVWSEKSTMAGVLRPITREFGVAFSAVHGFNSASLMRKVAKMSARDRRDVIILYVGDWDPSGMFMSEVDLPGRLEEYGGKVTVRRIALLREDLHGLPSVTAKPSDPRFKWFKARYGTRAWEVDALDPNTLRERVRDAILGYIEPHAWARMQLAEQAEQATVQRVAQAIARG
jgi:hypothetical protein